MMREQSMKDKSEVDFSFEHLAQSITAVDSLLCERALKAVNRAATLRNWLIGAYIVEYEQNGSDRAKYGGSLLKDLENRVCRSGMTVTLFQTCRRFYRLYPQVAQEALRIYATVSHKSGLLPEEGAGEECTDLPYALPRLTAPSEQSTASQYQTPANILVSRLSFSHIRELTAVDDPLVRFFYETECIKGTWSVRELRRQISTNLHVRVGLSEDKLKLMSLATSKAELQTPRQIIRDPYTFEFLGLSAKDVVSEDDLEDALILHLQEFLLELGSGFCFEARQKRIIIDGEYCFADLVFYHRILHCNVIVELKNDEFRHEYIGQLNAYVNYYAENEMHEGDSLPVGILLCTRKGKKMVEYALGSMNSQLFVSTYSLKLPDPKTLEAFILSQTEGAAAQKGGPQ